MIITFEEHTFEITPYEHDVVLPALVEYIQGAGDDVELTNQYLSKALENVYGIPGISPIRIRKLIHIIRCTDEIPFLIATGKGYMTTLNEEKIETYIKSLEQRIEKICITKNAIKRQLDNKNHQKQIEITWTTQ